MASWLEHPQAFLIGFKCASVGIPGFAQKVYAIRWIGHYAIKVTVWKCSKDINIIALYNVTVHI
jgi:hypothetical protein